MIKKIDNNGWGVVVGLMVKEMYFGENAYDCARRLAMSITDGHVMIIRIVSGTDGETSAIRRSWMTSAIHDDDTSRLNSDHSAFVESLSRRRGRSQAIPVPNEQASAPLDFRGNAGTNSQNPGIFMPSYQAHADRYPLTPQESILTTDGITRDAENNEIPGNPGIIEQVRSSGGYTMYSTPELNNAILNAVRSDIDYFPVDNNPDDLIEF